MPDISTYLRFVVTGFLFVHAIGVCFPKPTLYWIYSSEKNAIIFFSLLSPLIGIILESWTRSHPCRDDVQEIYAHLRRLIVGRFAQTNPIPIETPVESRNFDAAATEMFFSILAKVTYESFIWTFSGSELYMRRVNQQVRIAYTYLNLSRSLLLVVILCSFSLAIRLFVNLLVPELPIHAFVNNYFLPWLPYRLFHLEFIAIFWIVIVVVCVLLSVHFRSTAVAIFQEELDGRLAILKKYEIDLITTIESVISDAELLADFHEKASRRSKRRKYGQYWK